MTTCPVCGNQVPTGEYCGACGAHLPTGSVRRLGAFAADPAQHVLHPNVISTLFPHLPHRQSAHFRLGLLLVSIVLLALGMMRLTGPATAVAAASVPLLYLLYLSEVEVYEEEPLLVIGLTFGLGLLLGLPWGILTGPIVTHALLHNATAGPSWGTLLGAGVLVPLGAQVLMLAGAAVLYLRGRHREPLDGFTFGAAGALGFTLATTLVNLAPELHLGLVGGASPVTNALMVLGRGLLIPFLNASTTGLIAGALWSRRRPSRKLPLCWSTSIPACLAVAVVVRVILGVTDITVLRLGAVVTIDVIVAAALLVWMRIALHAMLLDEAHEVVVGPDLPCSNCCRVVPRMAFCPQCGIATGATPKVGPGRLRRPAVSGESEEVTPTAAYRLARPDEIEGLSRGRHRLRVWSVAAGVILAGALALGIAAEVLTPSRRAACGATCRPPPPPCVGTCRHASAAPPLRAHHSYTSSAYGYTVDYPQFAPSHQDASSVGWDLSTGTGQYSVDVIAADANGQTAQQIVGDVINNNFPDYNLVYAVPGAEVGYVPGAGAVYDNEVTPFLGTASDSRLVVLAAVKNGLAIAVVGTGDAVNDQSSPDPSGLPISSFIDNLASGTRWPGASPG